MMKKKTVKKEKGGGLTMHCKVCDTSKKLWNTPGPFNFKHCGFRFDTRSGWTLCIQCAVETLKKTFDDYGKKFISFTRTGEVEIDWHYYLDQMVEKGEPHFRRINDMLQSIGILSAQPMCHYRLWLSGDNGYYCICNSFGTELYFTRDPYIRGYVRALEEKQPRVLAGARMCRINQDWEEVK